MKKWIFALSLTLATGTAVQAQKTVKFSAAKHNSYGLVYNLPRTAIEVEVVTQKVTKKVGPYYKYANMYLGVSDIIAENSVEWQLKDVTMSTLGIPDKKEQYMVQFRSGSTPYIYLNENGVLLSINAEPQVDTLSVTEAIAQTSSVLDNNAYTSVMSEEMLRSSSEAKMAELAAKQIYRIRESKLDLITGNVDNLPADGESFKLVISQLDEQEKALLALFFGTEQVEQVVERIVLEPSGSVANDVLFRFSKRLGVLEKDDLAGAPIYLNLNITERGEYPVNAKGDRLSMPKEGLAYTIPGRARVTLDYEGKQLVASDLMFAQFGVVYGLEPNMFDDKKRPAHALFSPETGALRLLGE